MEVCKKEKKTRVYRKLRQRAIRRTVKRIKARIDAYLNRRMVYSRMSPFNSTARQKYYVKHDYSVEPFEEDPYEGEDLVNIDHMDDKYPL